MKQQPKYDLIGDIHGHADTLRSLLDKLGYEVRNGVYHHPEERRVIFVGDFVDRGPKIRETLQIVRGMVEAEIALAVLGNHEFNAIRFHTFVNGKPLRPHSEKNVKQHRATLDQLAIPHPEEWAGWLDWFKKLPLFLDLGELRVVHAAWCEKSVAFLGNRRFNDDQLLIASSQPRTPEYKAVSAVLNGPELTLPEGCFYESKEGSLHGEIRVKWFGPRDEAPTYRSLVFPECDRVPDVKVSAEELAEIPHYRENKPPVIFGHYWMPVAAPRRQARNVACVDYSVAAPKGGLLTAYRWNGEAELVEENFVTVERIVAPVEAAVSAA